MKAGGLHGWTSGGEPAVETVFADAFAVAGSTRVDTAITGAYCAGSNRSARGHPRMVVPVSTGAPCDGFAANGVPRNPGEVAARGKWPEWCAQPW